MNLPTLSKKSLAGVAATAAALTVVLSAAGCNFNVDTAEVTKHAHDNERKELVANVATECHFDQRKQQVMLKRFDGHALQVVSTVVQANPAECARVSKVLNKGHSRLFPGHEKSATQRLLHTLEQNNPTLFTTEPTESPS